MASKLKENNPALTMEQQGVKRGGVKKRKKR